MWRSVAQPAGQWAHEARRGKAPASLHSQAISRRSEVLRLTRPALFLSFLSDPTTPKPPTLVLCQLSALSDNITTREGKAHHDGLNLFCTAPVPKGERTHQRTLPANTLRKKNRAKYPATHSSTHPISPERTNRGKRENRESAETTPTRTPSRE